MGHQQVEHDPKTGNIRIETAAAKRTKGRPRRHMQRLSKRIEHIEIYSTRSTGGNGRRNRQGIELSTVDAKHKT